MKISDKIIEIASTYDEMVVTYPVGSKLTYVDGRDYEVTGFGQRNNDPSHFPTLTMKLLNSKPNSVTQEVIDDIIKNSEKEVFHAVFGKQCIVVLLLPNGFTVVGESGCVDPDNYDKKIGERIAMQKITEQIWMLEGYKLQNELNL